MAWSQEQAFRFELVLGLRKGVKTCHGLRRQLTENDEKLIADRIVEQLRLSGYRVEHNGAEIDLAKRIFREAG